MNKISLLLLIFCLLKANQSKAQDIIYTNSGQTIASKVMTVGTTEVVYKKYDFQEGPSYTKNISEISKIIYENGSVDSFGITSHSAVVVNNNVVNTDLQTQGRNDARTFYHAENCGAGWIGVAPLFISPLLGVIPAAICASIPPNYQNLYQPNQELSNNSEYYNSYLNEAHKIKKRKIWKSFGIGSAANTVLVLLLL